MGYKVPTKDSGLGFWTQALVGSFRRFKEPDGSFQHYFGSEGLVSLALEGGGGWRTCKQVASVQFISEYVIFIVGWRACFFF